MGSEKQKEEIKGRLGAQFEEMYEELYAWREEHAGASFDEIANEVTPRRQALMGKMLEELARQHGSGAVVEGVKCEKCGQAMRYKGEPKRGIGHLEGETTLYRAYYWCPHCKGGVFPPGWLVEVEG
jgi:hypothetical protein